MYRIVVYRGQTSCNSTTREVNIGVFRNRGIMRREMTVPTLKPRALQEAKKK